MISKKVILKRLSEHLAEDLLLSIKHFILTSDVEENWYRLSLWDETHTVSSPDSALRKKSAYTGISFSPLAIPIFMGKTGLYVDSSAKGILAFFYELYQLCIFIVKLAS